MDATLRDQTADLGQQVRCACLRKFGVRDLWHGAGDPEWEASVADLQSRLATASSG